ncbi:MAG TPA: hypothetical protein VM555_03055 [Tahibacter sp.]|jgi:hypothetical protein|nr:hypothetical protein [Tahibacter sp.]
MIRYTRPLLAVCAVLALAACQQESAPPAKPAAPAPSSTPATPPPAATPPAATAGTIGIPECDNYLTKYEACVAGKVPEAARDALRQGLEQTRTAWKNAAANEASKASLASACTQAHEAAKSALSAYGCSDF